MTPFSCSYANESAFARGGNMQCRLEKITTMFWWTKTYKILISFYAVLHNLFIHSLPKFNLPLIGAFTWFTPPRPYSATTCGERELILDHIHTFCLDHTRTWSSSTDEGSAQCRGHLRDNTNMKDDTYHSRTIHANKTNMKGWLWRPNDIRGP